MAKVARIGLGVMGDPMSGHIRKKGGHVSRATIATAPRPKLGAKNMAATPRRRRGRRQGRRFVFCCIGDDNDLRDVTLGPEGALTIAQRRNFVDNTTASADIARELFAAAETKGFDFLDAPVSAVKPVPRMPR